jgi:sulfhydrogenase subunit beta (sulfur reductase)
MKVVKIDKQKWTGGIEALKNMYRLYGPVKGDRFHNFTLLDKGIPPDFNFQNTRLSPKAIIYPQTEVMFHYTLDESKEDHHIMKEVTEDAAPRAIVGIRPCDAAAFLLVKRNFDTPEYRDPYWVRAYEGTTLVGLACRQPCQTCFCTTAGCGPFHEEGLDVLLVEEMDAFLAKAITAKGENLLKTAGWGEATDSGPIEAMKLDAETRIRTAVPTDQLAEKTIPELFDAPFWEDVAFACINCGTCTYVCPTCWCFDIQEEVSGKSGLRMRNWDSCMYPLFTFHGSGHNPRNTQTKRVRQRFMHKLKYYVDKYHNGIQCVGCGRCIRQCPVNIDIRRVCELMNNYETCR